MRSQHLFVVAAALAVAVLVVAWLFRDADLGAADPMSREPDAGTRASTALDAPDPRTAPSSSSSDEFPRTAAAVADAPKASVDEQAPRGLEVVPVRGARRERVGEAEVWFWPLSLAEERSGTSSFARAERTGTIDEGLTQFAQLLERRVDGRWYAPQAGEGRLIARASGLWGLAKITRNSEAPLLIALQPEVEVRARVLDATGAAVPGVRVALRQFWDAASFTDHGSALSGSEGIARLRHLRQLVGGDWNFDARFAVAIDEPLLASVHVEIDIVRPPSEVLELRMPAFGSVRVELVAAPPDSEVAIEVFDLDEHPDEIERERDSHQWLPLEDGKAHFGCVEAGRQLLVWLRSGTFQAPVDEVLRPGPQAQGESVVLRLQAQPVGVTFAGRVVDEQGAPLGDADFEVDLCAVQQNRSEILTRERGRTASDGRLVFRTTEDISSASQFELKLRDERNVLLGSAGIAIAPPAAGASVELGDVRIAVPNVLAAGRVLDVAGQPVPRAWVELHEPVHGTDRDGSVLTNWVERSRPVRTDEQGNFVLRGRCEAGSIRLRARGYGASSPPREFPVGASNLELRLEQARSIAGRVKLPPALSTDFVWISAVPRMPTLGEWSSRRYQWARLDTAGEFVLRDLELGAHDICVAMWSRETEFARVENVQVAASGETRDPRLDPLDLSGLELRAVTVFAPNGKPLSEGLAMSPMNGEAEVERYWFSNGKLLVGYHDPTLWIVAEDCMIERFEPASRVEKIQLRPAAKLRVQLQGPLAPPPEPYELQAWIVGRGDPAFLFGSGSDFLEVDGAEIEGAVRRLGAVTFHLELRKGDDRVAECEWSDFGPIVDTDRLQVFEMSTAPAQFLEALAKAREERR